MLTLSWTHRPPPQWICQRSLEGESNYRCNITTIMATNTLMHWQQKSEWGTAQQLSQGTPLNQFRSLKHLGRESLQASLHLNISTPIETLNKIICMLERHSRVEYSSAHNLKRLGIKRLSAHIFIIITQKLSAESGNPFREGIRIPQIKAITTSWVKPYHGNGVSEPRDGNTLFCIPWE